MATNEYQLIGVHEGADYIIAASSKIFPNDARHEIVDIQLQAMARKFYVSALLAKLKQIKRVVVDD